MALNAVRRLLRTYNVKRTKSVRCNVHFSSVVSYGDNGLASGTEQAALRTQGNTQCVINAAAYPEDEVEEEKHVLDTFGAAFDSHG